MTFWNPLLLEKTKNRIIQNMAVFDCDFLHDDIEKVVKANLVAALVDGEEVYKA